jgi:hypothetical protein
MADVDRAAQADAERECLVRELARAVGLGGRDRRAASASERARSAVKILALRVSPRTSKAPNDKDDGHKPPTVHRAVGGRIAGRNRCARRRCSRRSTLVRGKLLNVNGFRRTRRKSSAC